MKFGKLADISGVDFSLPADHDFNHKIFDSPSPQSSLPKVYIGCTGWSMKEWVGQVYPKGTKTKDYLRAYAKQFNTIELNTTHYRIPTVDTIQKWKEESTSDFKFCPKILQRISHAKDLGLESGMLMAFCEAIQGLEEKLGCCFMQMPPYYGLDRQAALLKFIERFPTHIPLAIELRHESWFADLTAAMPLLEAMRERRMPLVITDVAGRRDVLHQCLTAPVAMIRFVGNALVPSDYSRIDEWVERLKAWTENGLQEVYFFPHEPDNILAPQLAAYLQKQLQSSFVVESRGPNLIDDQKGQQISLF